MRIGPGVATKGLCELLAVALVSAAAFLMASRELRGTRERGESPFFHQGLFEPAVRLACGQPFGVDRGGDLSAEMRAFLRVERQSLTCDDVAPARDPDAYPVARAWYHLLAVTGALWKVTGISWLAMDRVAALLMSLSAVFVYGLFRLWTPIPVAVAVSLLSAWTGAACASLLRDTSKAPFILAALWIVGVLILRTPTRRALFAAMAGVGLWLGIGYGFRPDVLIALPLLAVAAIFVRPAGARGAWRDGAIGATLMAAAFLLAARPAFPGKSTTVGSCYWHFALLGLSDWHTELLGLQRGEVSLLTLNHDTLVWRTVTVYAQRRFGLPDVGYCTPSYDSASKSLYFEILRTFPRDIAARGLGAVSQLLDYGVRGLPPIVGGNQQSVPFIRKAWKVAWIVLLLALLAHSVRLGLFALFALLYLCAYPALQFDHRHYFHLAFLAWVPPSALVVLLANWARSVLSSARAGQINGWHKSLPLAPPAAWRRAVAILAAMAAVAGAAYWAAAQYQRGVAGKLFTRYLRAPGITAPVLASEDVDGWFRTTYAGFTPPGDPPFAGRALRVEFGGGECNRTRRRRESGGLRSGLHTLTVVVSAPHPDPEFRNDQLVLLPPDGPPAVVFLPLYYFRSRATQVRVELPSKDAACLGKAEWVDPDALPALWVSAALHPGA